MGFLLNNDGENDFLLADTYSKDHIFWITLRGLISKGKIDEAEDMLFKEAEKNPYIEIYEIGEKMYSLLANKSEEELKKCNFSKEEIDLGLEDLKRLIDKHSL
ncbi:MAG: DUF6483 family protein [Clostridium perfringens]|nr:DUF6483 family protein [Clostridium perfringens]MDU7954169.1 DUF6483 family protein [Clostridium perfringens]MDU7964146.1 DUF6483 family protein [Clostridium perfringens]